jgi:tRNA-(ms[2]io[6]A)-hydroxylase
MLQSRTDPRWVEVATGDALRLLGDHAHCEKKAAASAMAMVAAYPEDGRLVRRLSALAIEELRHFRAVHEHVLRRGLVLTRDPGDPYARGLQGLLRPSGAARRVDRLLVAALIEARSHERLELLAGALTDSALRAFYASLAVAEAGHARLFADLARAGADPGAAGRRLVELAAAESEILSSLPIAPRIH